MSVTGTVSRWKSLANGLELRRCHQPARRHQHKYRIHNPKRRLSEYLQRRVLNTTLPDESAGRGLRSLSTARREQQQRQHRHDQALTDTELKNVASYP